MVKCLGMMWILFGAAHEAAEPVLEQLDPPRRAAVIMALLALVLTGLMLVTFAMLGGHWVRRMARHEPRGAIVGNSDRRRVPAAIKAELPDIETSETIHLDTSSRDTKAES